MFEALPEAPCSSTLLNWETCSLMHIQTTWQYNMDVEENNCNGTPFRPSADFFGMICGDSLLSCALRCIVELLWSSGPLLRLLMHQ